MNRAGPLIVSCYLRRWPKQFRAPFDEKEKEGVDITNKVAVFRQRILQPVWTMEIV